MLLQGKTDHRQIRDVFICVTSRHPENERHARTEQRDDRFEFSSPEVKVDRQEIQGLCPTSFKYGKLFRETMREPESQTAALGLLASELNTVYEATYVFDA